MATTGTGETNKSGAERIKWTRSGDAEEPTYTSGCGRFRIQRHQWGTKRWYTMTVDGRALRRDFYDLATAKDEAQRRAEVAS